MKQADISRAVRAMKAAGVEAVRIVIERDRVVVEPREAEVVRPMRAAPVAEEEIVDL